MSVGDQHQLVEKLKDGCEESFALLYERYGTKIYNLAYRMVGNKEDAEDLTQETFIQIHRKIQDFRGDSQLYTWIYTITQNLCFRLYQQRDRVSFASLEALIYSAQGHAAVGDISEWEKQHLIRQIKDGCLTGLLRGLSFYQRVAFILHVLLHLPVREVAQILEKSEGATRVLVHRARQNLKVFLCQHCSLYDAYNPCHCENLLSFSLKQGWITPPSDADLNDFKDTQSIEDQIAGVRTVVELYTSLSEPVPAEELVDRIQQLIDAQDWAIFSHKKV